ncbi:MAG: aspA [Ilumatobacteraceae bacterium]|nr:aspA [Ilumatobacteraceae bacterium]
MTSTPPPKDHRTEHDALGDVAVPASALYGAHTVRAMSNFHVSGVTVADHPELIAALGHVKAAAARANVACGALEPRIADAILAAAREVARGEHDAQFPVPLVQGGGGTAINMNANEVIANRSAGLLGRERGRYDVVHPNDHVNRSQSTNDVFPTAMAIATVTAGRETVAQLAKLERSFRAKSAEAGAIRRLGRTCLQDAVPLTVAQTHDAHAHAVARTAAALSTALDGLLEVPLGATAIGTGIGAAPGYRDAVLGFLAEEAGLPIRGSADLFDALANLDAYVDVAAQLVRVALVAGKIAADLRFLSSGPVGGIGEVQLPSVQVGSSIMPGKINPVIPELVLQISYEVRGTATIVESAVAAGELELNVMEPVIARHLLASLRDVGRTAALFAERCVDGLRWNPDTLDAHLDGSLGAAVELAAEHGYSHVTNAG